ncbi:hypothetical protein H2202_007201 [Exophiala xenobiotica]|nr:hypothetical protein H2202_007201 [Exophiala xenobiotica]KAK5203929.1 hypothetical protein LTR41_010386 [Exophiala xenobiotica]KAK5216562.1 hypothetical protein LTR72_010485 [Exophiala xenobiotica]KAK5226627.1 hypothetical protein LTR47_008855 [Exophiala xenobiotica]KAK5252792.1 hypothetical protein LTS06_002740 [Exophiala xenobiotica]
MRKVCDDIQSSTNHFSNVHSRRPSMKRRHHDNHDAALKGRLTYPANLVYPLDLARAFEAKRGAASTACSYEDHANQSPLTETVQSADTSTVILQAALPVFRLGYDRVLQYITMFRNEVYPMYPCIGLEFARNKIDALFAEPSPSSTGERQELDVDLIDIEITKVVLAISMLIESDGHNPLSSDLEAHLIWNVDMKQEAVQIEDIIMATLMTIYFILEDQPVKAWRMSGFGAKACLELGLHKESSLDTRDDSLADKAFLKDIFSCVYDLDKRSSFYTNLPWTLHEKDLDENVFDLNGRHPYLSAMVRVNRLHSEIVELINSSPGLGTKEIDERAEFLGYRLQKLVEIIHESEMFPPESPEPLPPPATRTVMEAFVTLRTTHIRMLTHMRSLSSFETFSLRPQSVQILISLAISSVDLHGKIVFAGGDEGASRLLRTTIDKLLTVCVSCMFLAASYDPQVYGPICRNAFHTAINILSQAQSLPNEHSSKTMLSSLADLRRMGESIQMPALDRSTLSTSAVGTDGSATQNHQVQPDFGEMDFSMLSETPNPELFASMGDVDSNWEFEVEHLPFG